MPSSPPDLLSDTSRIVPDSEPFALTGGIEVELVPLKSRQLFRLLRIITHGARDAIAGGYLNFNLETEQFGSRLTFLVLMAVPDAEQEAIDFVTSMLRPAHLHEGVVSKLTAEQQEENQAKWAAFGAEMFNPEPADLVEIISKIVAAEAGDLQALGKRLWALAEPFFKSGAADKPAEPPPTAQQMAEQAIPDEPPGAVRAGVPAGSPSPSTSSARSTAGPTSKSLTSPSAASARSPQPSAPAASTSS